MFNIVSSPSKYPQNSYIVYLWLCRLSSNKLLENVSSPQKLQTIKPHHGHMKELHMHLPLIIQHTSFETLCSPYVTFWSWFDTIISFKDHELLDPKSFEKNQPQTYMDHVSMLDGWEIRSYATIPLTLHHLLELENISEANYPWLWMLSSEKFHQHCIISSTLWNPPQQSMHRDPTICVLQGVLEKTNNLLLIVIVV